MAGSTPKKSKSKSPRKSSSGKRRSKSSRKSSGNPTYSAMIHTAVSTLNEKGGSTRQELWKFMEAKFPNANRKLFLVRLKKYSSAGGFLSMNSKKSRFRISKEFKDGLERRLKKGMTVAAAQLKQTQLVHDSN